MELDIKNKESQFENSKFRWKLFALERKLFKEYSHFSVILNNIYYQYSIFGLTITTKNLIEVFLGLGVLNGFAGTVSSTFISWFYKYFYYYF